MRRRVLAGTVIVLAVLLAGALALLLVPDARRVVLGLLDSRLVAACETALLDRLKAPSTYARVSATESSEPIRLADYYVDAFSRNGMPGAAEQELNRRVHDHATRWTVLIEYDAANGFGTPIRGVSACTYSSLDGGTKGVSALLVKIDGKTKTQWLVEALKAR